MAFGDITLFVSYIQLRSRELLELWNVDVIFRQI
jgi:hypothetical protein